MVDYELPPEGTIPHEGSPGAHLYAELTEDGTVERVVAAFEHDAALMDLYGPIEDIDPQPRVGFKLKDGQWIPSRQYLAHVECLRIAQEIDQVIAKAREDSEVIDRWQAGKPPNETQLQALRRQSEGLVGFLEAFQHLLTSLGHYETP